MRSGRNARETAREFFAPAKEAYAAAEDKGSALAYLLGFVCHFALDSACHGYIENKIAVSGVTHTEIESEFDRSLLLQDGATRCRRSSPITSCRAKQTRASSRHFLRA